MVKVLCFVGFGGVEGVDFLLFGDGVDVFILGLFLFVDDDLFVGFGVGGDGVFEFFGLVDEILCEFFLVGEDGVVLGVNVGFDVKGLEDVRDIKE